MKKLNALILKSFIGPFVVVFFVVMFVLLMQFMWRYIDEFVGKGLEFYVILEFLLYVSASLVHMALPLAILMSSLMTFGNLGEKYDITAIKASGISLQRIMKPMFIVIIALSVGAFFFANNILPYTNLKMYTLLMDIRHKRPTLNIKAGEFYNGIDGYSIRVNEKIHETGQLYGVKIYDHTKNWGNVSVTIADSGRMIVSEDQTRIVFTLYSGYGYTEEQNPREHKTKRTYPHRYDIFEEQEIIISLTGFDLKRSENNMFQNHHMMLDLTELSNQRDTISNFLEKRYENLEKAIVESGPALRMKKDPKKLKKVEKQEIDTTKILQDPKPGSLSPRLKDQFKKVITIEDVVADSNVMSKGAMVLSPDSIFSILSIDEKEDIISTALNHAQQAKHYTYNAITEVNYKTGTLRRLEIETNRKFVIAFSCIVFLLLGAPLGAIIRKGGLGLPLVLTTLFFIFWYIIGLSGEKMVRESIAPAVVGMWTPSAVFLVVGMFLTYKATTDSSMMNLDTYANFLKKIFGQRYRLIDLMLKEVDEVQSKEVQKSTMLQSMRNFIDKISEQEEETLKNIRFPGFLLSMVGVESTTDIIMFERLYKNNMRYLMHSNFYNERMVRSKMQEFPNFNYNVYFDTRWRFIVKLVLLFLPPITILIVLRHYILLISLKNRLKAIKQLSQELYKTIEQT